jgi:hypothetical protein
MQDEAPVAGWYLPDMHRLQLAELAAPVVAQYLPPGQSMQALVPDVGRYFPAGHWRHAA